MRDINLPGEFNWDASNVEYGKRVKHLIAFSNQQYSQSSEKLNLPLVQFIHLLVHPFSCNPLYSLQRTI
jgi:hypothetical protein